MITFIKNNLYIYLAVINLLDFFLYGADKYKAKKHKWRIPEKTLLGMGLLGGCVGGLFGMQIFRHKTKHLYFYVINILAIIIWTALVYFWFYK